MSAPSQSAADRSVPQRSASTSRKAIIRATPDSATSRMPTIPSGTAALATARKTGPYGVGVCCQIGGTSAASGPPSRSAPCAYTSMCAAAIVPCTR